MYKTPSMSAIPICRTIIIKRPDIQKWHETRNSVCTQVLVDCTRGSTYIQRPSSSCTWFLDTRANCHLWCQNYRHRPTIKSQYSPIQSPPLSGEREKRQIWRTMSCPTSHLYPLSLLSLRPHGKRSNCRLQTPRFQPGGQMEALLFRSLRIHSITPFDRFNSII
jgi:hypothetical protein